MLKKTFLGVLFAVFVSGLLIAGIGFNVTKAVDYGSSGTTVGGYISENTTWTLDGSPYIVTGDVIVESNVFVTIEPGVIVKFKNGTNLVIDGALMARGNVTHSILFTSNATSPKPGDWGSILFRESNVESVIEWAVIEHGDIGINIDRARPVIKNCTISKNNIGLSVTRSSIIIEKSSFTDNKGQGIFVPHVGASLVLREIIVSSNGGDGIWTGDGAQSVTITKSAFLNNTGNGITIFSSDQPWSITETAVLNNAGNGIHIYAHPSLVTMYIAGCNISYNRGTGVYREKYGEQAEYPADEIRYSTIKANNQSGIYYSNKPLDVHYSNLLDNVPYDVKNSFPNDINSTHNWWGTTNATLIDERIYDYYDDFNVGKVFYKPFLVPPVVNFTFSPETLYACGTVTFDASASFNPYGSIIDYAWDFGDGNITTIASPTINHSYAIPGTYNVALTVTDEFGLTNSTVTSLTVLQDDVPPTTVNDYDGEWRNANFTITLTATDLESGVAETYYRINDGPAKTVSSDGEPPITTEGANNTLEYWSVDNAGNEEFPHKMLTGIKLDQTPPLIGVPFHIPEDDVQPDQEVKVSVNVTDSLSGVKNVLLSYNLNDSPVWTNVTMAFNLTTGLYEAIIPEQQADTLVKYKITAYDNAGNNRVEDNSGQYYVYTIIPEFPSTVIFLLALLFTTFAVIIGKKRLPENLKD